MRMCTSKLRRCRKFNDNDEKTVNTWLKRYKVQCVNLLCFCRLCSFLFLLTLFKYKDRHFDQYQALCAAPVYKITYNFDLFSGSSAIKAVHKSLSISFPMSRGSVVGAKRSTGCPFLSHKNLVKFHLIALPKKPFCLFRKYLYSGMADSPLTLTWWEMEKNNEKNSIVLFHLICRFGITFAITSPMFAFAFFKWQTISSPLLSGICDANWLHGKAKIRSPLS